MSSKRIAQIVVNLLLFVLLAEAAIRFPGDCEQFYILILLMYIVSMLVVNHVFENNNETENN